MAGKRGHQAGCVAPLGGQPALPVLGLQDDRHRRAPMAVEQIVGVGGEQREARPILALAVDAGKRSEERRVGKECVSSVDLGGRRIIKKKKKHKVRERTKKVKSKRTHPTKKN